MSDHSKEPSPIQQAYDEHARSSSPPPLPEEPAAPGARPTLRMSKDQLDALNAAITQQHEARTAEIVGALDRGLRAVFEDLSFIRSEMTRHHDDVKLWLFGFGADVPQGAPVRSIAHDLGITREQASSALAGLNALAGRFECVEHQLEAALRVACASYDGIFHGPEHVSREERQTCEALRDQARSAR